MLAQVRQSDYDPCPTEEVRTNFLLQKAAFTDGARAEFFCSLEQVEQCTSSKASFRQVAELLQSSSAKPVPVRTVNFVNKNERGRSPPQQPASPRGRSQTPRNEPESEWSPSLRPEKLDYSDALIKRAFFAGKGKGKSKGKGKRPDRQDRSRSPPASPRFGGGRGGSPRGGSPRGGSRGRSPPRSSSRSAAPDARGSRSRSPRAANRPGWREPCRDHARGRCTRGEECKFFHARGGSGRSPSFAGGRRERSRSH